MRRGLEQLVRCLWDAQEKLQTVFLRDEKRRPALGKEGCLATAKVLAGLQNDELEAGYSARSSP